MSLVVPDLIAALKRRWRLEALIFVATLLAIALWTMVTPRVYLATSSLLFDDSAVDPVQDGKGGEENVTALLATQADVLTSGVIATEVARAQQMMTPALKDLWRRQASGAGDVNAWMGRRLLESIEVTPERSSRVLKIHFRSTTPVSAARGANGFAAAYLSARLKQKTDPARTYSRWFEDRTREVRSTLEKAQASLTDYQRLTGIVDNGEANAETNRLSELSSQLASAEGATADMRARANNSASQSPEVQSSAVVQTLRSEIAVRSAALSLMSATLGPKHPKRIAAEAELEQLRGRLKSEIGVATRSVIVASGAAATREADLRNRLEGQRSRMLGLAGNRARFRALERDVETSQAAYDVVTQKLRTMRLQAEAPTNNVRQLDFASPPLLPATPDVMLRLFLGALLGGLLAFCAGAALEWRRPRIRTAPGAVLVTGVPVLARINLARSSIAPLLKAGIGK
jgi:succinoglycan biosynthesis transport protein ExoP